VDFSFSEQLLRVVFSTFGGQKNNLKFLQKHFSNRTKNQVKLFFEKFLKI
jgi:hypothetical protein